MANETTSRPGQAFPADPQPDPEPAPPSLPEPDPGVFHHTPATKDKEEQ